jgi:hypothetical protein
MKTWIKFILLSLLVLVVTGCVSMVPREKLEDWAFQNGYILAEDCPDIVVPERQPLDHPEVPYIEVKDSEGNYIPITVEYLMQIIVKLFGTVEKYQFLAEIYEREYLNAGGQIMPDLTLKELKALYLERINAIDNVPQPEETEEPTTEGEFPVLGATSEDLELTPEAAGLTVEEFAVIVEIFNHFQETGAIE